MHDLSWLILVLLSSLIHPFRGVRAEGQSLAAFQPLLGYTAVWIVLGLVQALISGQSLVLPSEVWWLLCVSVVGLVLYYFGTLEALKRGDLSVYYPIIRSSPVVVLAFGWIVLRQSYSPWVVAGVGLVFAGTLMLQKPKQGLLSDPRSLLLALLAMVGSATYTLSDASAMRSVSPSVYLFYTYLFVGAALGGILIWQNRQQGAWQTKLWEGWRAQPRRTLIAGVLAYASYMLILVALQNGDAAAD